MRACSPTLVPNGGEEFGGYATLGRLRFEGANCFAKTEVRYRWSTRTKTVERYEVLIYAAILWNLLAKDPPSQPVT
ncbi:hypothetical protein VN97_g7357 [Penicillium thymicola]|uniref:Uncharacterized protein n=1 Tax=Penicillium thymicola TaxID=293382 RepID=A0AAI9TEW8_PENTH|nr:hypothetical protein VN97_g7357 [Penicillium thymicola]